MACLMDVVLYAQSHLLIAQFRLRIAQRPSHCPGQTRTGSCAMGASNYYTEAGNKRGPTLYQVCAAYVLQWRSIPQVTLMHADQDWSGLH